MHTHSPTIGGVPSTKTFFNRGPKTQKQQNLLKLHLQTKFTLLMCIDPSLVSHLQAATTILISRHCEVSFHFFCSFLLMVQVVRALFQQNHPLAIKIKIIKFGKY